MISCLPFSKTLGALISISITLGYTYVNAYTSVDGRTFTLTTSSLVFVYIICASHIAIPQLCLPPIFQ
jgi:hypothetical protein